MTLTTAQQVRLRIQDIPAIFDDTREFDGSASAFALPYRNITSGTAYVPAAGGWTATGATLNTSGYVTFSAVGSAHSAFRVRGVYSVFSDEDIGHFTAAGGSVPGAAREAVNVLLFDAVKRAKWAAPDGTQYDDTAAIGHLSNLHAKLTNELVDAGMSAGAFASWAEGQADW